MKDFKTAAKTVGGNEGSKCKHTTRLDTFGCGCAHDCKYCYAKSLLEFRGLWNPQNPSIGELSKISRQVKRLPQEVVRLGGMTDCFQPAEALHRITHKTIRLLNRRKIPYLIVTKSAMIAEYTDVLDKELAHVQITVTTLDDKLSATYEQASPPSERVKAIKSLQEGGYDVQLRLSPFVPEFMDTDRLSELGIDKICLEFLRVNGWIKRWFDVDYEPYTIKQGGYLHMPLEKKIEYVDRIKGFKEMTVCEDEDRAYEYWIAHVNHNPADCCNLRGVNETQSRVRKAG